jgi:D-arginine dehydrogenase
LADTQNKLPDYADFVIIGGGLAGMSTAWGLSLLGEHDVVVLEKEDFPGMHSSGRNAAMIRQLVPGEELLGLSTAGARFYAGDAPGWRQPPPFMPDGSFLSAGPDGWAALEKNAQAATDAGVQLEMCDLNRITEAVPCVAGGRIEGGAYCPGDGVTDTDGLIQGYRTAAKAGGARLLTTCEVQNIDIQNGRVSGVQTSRGYLKTGNLVNAAGPWAGLIGSMAGAVKVELAPLRRHLYYTGALEWADQHWPFVWDVDRDVYFRPESGGLLLSACDESAAKPALPVVDPAVQDLLASKLSDAFPMLLDVPIARSWAGLRTFAPDRAFMLGHDPVLDGFYWVAALGGHGVTTSPAVGRIAAGDISGRGATAPAAFSPSRFA